MTDQDQALTDLAKELLNYLKDGRVPKLAEWALTLKAERDKLQATVFGLKAFVQVGDEKLREAEAERAKAVADRDALKAQLEAAFCTQCGVVRPCQVHDVLATQAP